jgi:hypothetical protein
MKPKVKEAAARGAKWAFGLSAGYVLGPIVFHLASGTGPGGLGEMVAMKLIGAIVWFPILFLGIWAWGAFSNKGAVTGASIGPASQSAESVYFEERGPIADALHGKPSIRAMAFAVPLTTPPMAHSPAPTAGSVEAGPSAPPAPLPVLDNDADEKRAADARAPTHLSAASMPAGSLPQRAVNVSVPRGAPAGVTDRFNPDAPSGVMKAAGNPLVRRAFAAAMEEVKTRTYEPGLWAMSLVECNGDERAAGLAYVKARAEEIALADANEGESTQMGAGQQEVHRGQLEAAQQRPPRVYPRKTKAERIPALIDLLIAERRHRVDLVTEIINQNPKLIHEKDLDGGTALHTAVEQRNLSIVKALLEHGADPRAVNNRGTSVLEIGMRWGTPEIVSEIEARLERVPTAETTEAALAAGGREAWKNFEMARPADEAALSKVLPALKALTADPSIVNTAGDDVMSYALRHGYLNLAWTALRCELTIPALVGGKTPLGLWIEGKPEGVASFAREELLPRLLKWIRARVAPRGLAETLPVLLRGVDIEARKLVQPLAEIGISLHAAPGGFVLAGSKSESGALGENFLNERELNRQARWLMLAWLDREMRADTTSNHLRRPAPACSSNGFQHVVRSQ